MKKDTMTTSLLAILLICAHVPVSASAESEADISRATQTAVLKGVLKRIYPGVKISKIRLNIDDLWSPTFCTADGYASLANGVVCKVKSVNDQCGSPIIRDGELECKFKGKTEKYLYEVVETLKIKRKS